MTEEPQPKNPRHAKACQRALKSRGRHLSSRSSGLSQGDDRNDRPRFRRTTSARINHMAFALLRACLRGPFACKLPVSRRGFRPVRFSLEGAQGRIGLALFFTAARRKPLRRFVEGWSPRCAAALTSPVWDAVRRRRSVGGVRVETPRRFFDRTRGRRRACLASLSRPRALGGGAAERKKGALF